MMFAGHSKKLIGLVRDHPEIWNTKHESYQKNHKREKAWEDVASQFIGQAWYDLSQEEQTVQVATLKNKWKNIRDNFKKSVKPRKSSTGAERPGPRRDYYNAEMLTFLLEDGRIETATSSKQSEDPLGSEESNSESGSKRFKMATSDDVDMTGIVKIESWSSVVMDEESLTSNSFEPTTAKLQPTTVEPLETHPNIQATISVVRPEPEQCRTSREKLQNGSDDFEKELLNILKTKVDNSSTYTAPAILSDPDAMFFLSQLPFVKSLSLADRMDFRIKFMQLLQSYTTKTD